MGLIAAVAAAGVVSAGSSLIAGGQAAGAAKDAAHLQALQQAQTRGDLLPFTQQGTMAGQEIANNEVPGGVYSTPDNRYIEQAEGFLGRSQTYADTAQAQADAASRIGSGPGGQAALEATPGYQFTLAQGLQANQNAMAAKGLGVSGAAMKGAATYATGLASQTYQQQYQNAMTNAGFTAGTGATYGGFANTSLNQNTNFQGNLQNSFNRLQATAQLGENAGSATGTTGQLAATSGGNALIAGGNAQAAGTLGVGNSATGAANNFLTFNALNNLTNPAANTPNVNTIANQNALNNANTFSPGEAVAF
jgi:hypothetical protein